MRILAIADVESKYLWDYYEKSKLEDIDLIVSAGDLEAAYLEFLATMAKCPVVYVPGNHDKGYKTKPPEGCICVDDTIYTYKGVRIMGLGGSMNYNYGTYQYSEFDMFMRIVKMKRKLLMSRGIDILLTHAPAKGLNDGSDLPHQGFKCFLKLLRKRKPKLFIHGHVHMNYGREFKRETMFGDTKVINAFDKYIIDVDFDKKK